MKKTLIGLVAAALALSACGGPALENTLKLNDDPNSVLLIVRDEGGFVPIEFIVGQGPRLVLLRDGTLIVPGPQIEIFPQPLLPSYQSTRLDEENMLFVLEELDALGLADIESEVNDDAANMVADAGTTVTTFYNQDGSHTFSVYALGVDSQASDARVPILANLVNRLSEMGFNQSGEAYQWEGLEVLAGVPQVPAEPDFANVQPWPLDVGYVGMTDIGFGWRCASYSGDDAQALLATFLEANQATTWDDGGTEYSIRVRPLFPGEDPCVPVASAG